VHTPRRGLLGILLVGAAAGCGGGSAGARRSPDDAIRAQAADAARRLAALYEAALAQGSVARAQAEQFRDHHRAHARHLAAGAGADGSEPAVADTAVDKTAVAAALFNPTRTALADAELAAVRRSAPDLAAASGSLAALLASIAACRTLHAQSLAGSQSPDAPGLAAKTADRASTDALQTVLAAQNAVIFAFGALGPHLTGDRRAAARAAFDLHRGQRDALMEAIVARGASPQAARASYSLPFKVADAEDAGRLAGLVEGRLAAVCARAVSASSNESRRYAAWALTRAALGAQAWGAPVAAFPGLSA
jgi:hypothetical protein